MYPAAPVNAAATSISGSQRRSQGGKAAKVHAASVSGQVHGRLEKGSSARVG